MAHSIKLGTISKHEESTKRPNMSGWKEYPIVFKDGTDIVNPTITISADLATISACNYGYMMGRYYWIRGITSYRTGYVILDLETDVLATYKNEIGNTNLYILRSASNSDGKIIDNYYPTTGNITYGHSEYDYSPAGSLYSGGHYVVNVSGASSAGASTLWYLSPTAFSTFIEKLYLAIDGFQPVDIYDALCKLLGGQPEKLVSSAMWFPGNFTFDVSSSQRIFVGGWDSGVDGTLITDPIYELTPIELSITKHPQAATRGAFLNLSPFSIYTLTIPMFGCVNVDSTAILEATKIYINIKADALSGMAHAEIHSGGNPRPIIAHLATQLGVPIPLAGQNSGASVAGGIVSTLGNFVTAMATGGVSAAVATVASGIGTAISAMSGASFSSGSGGSALSTSYAISLDSTHLHVVNEDNTRNGRPYCQVAKPKNLSGYMLVQRGDVDIPGTLPEQQRIKMFLESGFFYE